jgi:hypothetical protein
MHHAPGNDGQVLYRVDRHHKGVAMHIPVILPVHQGTDEVEVWRLGREPGVQVLDLIRGELRDDARVVAVDRVALRMGIGFPADQDGGGVHRHGFGVAGIRVGQDRDRQEDGEQEGQRAQRGPLFFQDMGHKDHLLMILPGKMVRGVVPGRKGRGPEDGRRSRVILFPVLVSVGRLIQWENDVRIVESRGR